VDKISSLNKIKDTDFIILDYSEKKDLLLVSPPAGDLIELTVESYEKIVNLERFVRYSISHGKHKRKY